MAKKKGKKKSKPEKPQDKAPAKRSKKGGTASPSVSSPSSSSSYGTVKPFVFTKSGFAPAGNPGTDNPTEPANPAPKQVPKAMKDDKKEDKSVLKRGGLGRGLSALLGDVKNDEEAVIAAGSAVAPAAKPVASINEIPVGSIETNPYQPRTHFDQTALRELADSILAQGIIQPITVRKLAEGQYQLISGERRLQASKMAGLTQIPAYIRTANDEQMLEMALIENIQRENLNSIEVALAYKRLMDECGLILEEVGEKVGKNRSTVNNYLRLLRLPPEIQAAIRDEKISMGHARAIINVENPATQLSIFRDTMDKDLSVRQVEELVRQLSQQLDKKPDTKTAAKPDAKAAVFQAHLLELQRKLEDALETKVRLHHEPAGTGEIRITYYSSDELERLANHLKGE
jgi:ParB family chromosome partitioning protein